MIAINPTPRTRQYAPTLEDREYTLEESQQILRSVMNETFRRWLMKLALKWTGHNWQLSQDVVQETFVSLLKCQTYDPRKSAPTFFAVWRLRGMLQHQRRKAKAHEGVHRLKGEPPSRPLTLSVEEREVIDGVRSAINRLPEREANVLLHRLQGLKLREVATRFGVSVQRISKIEHDAMNSLVDQPLPV